ncbi:MAG: hypothetical protein A2Y62_02765 [Candidatus Fischerbacteria bacterium RBG_13_37_8]|uniref:Carboxypeptidase regulatory-like domain-containing protein n=1 Tax=Candidatus Fischerbacteria bacterium RBG_13_37_8 TaxID=1817863 RepID=A0A1F5VY54_9BACT|nr:MAG: hypothetical protein A2Y62_02765 [Candidatus Fischerbacteria bacterium RBG_13_37_8]
MKRIVSILLLIVLFSGIYPIRIEAEKRFVVYMSGQIFDDDEYNPVEGARIIIYHIDTGKEYTDVSNKEGLYTLKDLFPGLYNITIYYLKKDYKYTGQMMVEGKKHYVINACWATKHEKIFAKLLDRECRTDKGAAWWQHKEFLIIGGMVAAAAAAAIDVRKEEEASPLEPCCPIPE